MGIKTIETIRRIKLFFRDLCNVQAFVETGTYKAVTALWASSNFDQVYTIELSPDLYKPISLKYQNYANIIFLNGNSVEILPKIMAEISQPSIFWLDGHWSGSGTAGEENECPLLQEIEAINHLGYEKFIFIDDARLFLSPPPPPHNTNHWPTIAEIIKKIEQGVPDSYTVVYNDVIISIPLKYKDAFVRFLGKLNGLLAVAVKTNEPKICKPDSVDIRSEKIKWLMHDENVLGCLKNEGLWDRHSPLRLHLGCGENRLEGYINVDFPPTEHTIQTKSVPDIYADITKLRFPDQCVDEIRLHHVFEHFERTQALALLVQWHRWLKIGAKLHIETPDIIGCAEALVSDRPYADKQAILRHAFGSQEARWANHLDGWYAEKFQHVLSRFGFMTQCRKNRRTTWPYLTDVETIAVKENHRNESELLNDAAEILKDSLVSDVSSEQRMHKVWCDQLKHQLNKSDVQAKLEESKHQAKAPLSERAETLHRDISNLIVVNDCPAADYLGYDHDQMTENGELDFVSKIIKPSDVVFDVGANKGDWCEMLLGVKPEVTIFAFEPVLCAFKTLRTRLNNANVKPYNIAVSSTDKEEIFYHYGKDKQVEEMSSFYRRSMVEKRLNIAPSPMSVQCVSLDSFCSNHGIPKINFLKIDTEGSELDVLQGAKAMLRSGKIDVVQFEYGGTFLDAGISMSRIFEFLTGFGYRLFRIVPKGLIYISEWRNALETFRYSNYAAIATEPLTKCVNECLNDCGSNEAVCVIFSKDRAMQLDATISSLKLQCVDLKNIPVKVIYKISNLINKEQYNELQLAYPEVEFIPEKNFKQDLIAAIRNYELIVFLVDDNIFVRKFYLREFIDILKKQIDAVGFSLRLGKNTQYCYMLNRYQKLPEFKSITDEIITFNWVHAECDFAYPLELSSSIYRVKDIMPLVKKLNYKNPNHLESLLYENRLIFSEKMNRLLCSITSIAFCNPINKVQNVCASNRSGNNPLHTPEKLSELFGEGYRIEVAELASFIPNGCHQEVPLKMNKPDKNPIRVSVVIPCYNYGKYLREAVESVIDQKFLDFEIIIVNDGSTDNTKEVAEKLINEFSQYRIRVLNQENSGHPAIARNNGIAIAKGEYILPLDADDQIAMTMIERCVTLLNSNPVVDFVYTDRKDFDGIDQIVKARKYDFSVLKYQNHISYCAMFRKRVWENVGGYRVTGFEDWDFWIAAGVLGHKGYYLPEPLFRYRRHDTGKYQKDLDNEECYRAQIVLNNPLVYSRDEILKSATILKYRRPTKKPAQVCPLVSVVVPTYNRPILLEDAILSICNQSFQNIEIVVVNDGGDDVSKVCEKFKDVSIHYIEHDRNKGLAAARNTGINAAKGKYIAYLDDDDIFYPNHIETLIQLLEDTEYKVAYSDSYRAHFKIENGNYILTNKDLPYSFDFDPKRILVENYVPVLCFIHEKACIDEIGFFDENLSSHEDWDLWIRMSRIYNFLHIKKITSEFSWRTDGSTMTSGNRADMLLTLKAVYNKHADLVKKKKNIKLLQNENIKSLENQIKLKNLKIKCSIIIPVYNRLEYTRNCLKALFKNTPKENYEVIVVDNNSIDGTNEYLSKISKKVKIIYNKENLGFAKACNQGARMSLGEYLVFLNNDTEVQTKWLKTLVEVIEQNSSVAAVGSKMLFPDDKIQHAGVVIINDQKLPDPLVARHIYYRQDSNYPLANVMSTYQALTAACMLVRKSSFMAVGGFDENYWNGYEDIDLCFKLREKGSLLIYQPKSVVIHYESQSGPERFKRTQHNIDRLHKKWIGKIQPDLIIKPNGKIIETMSGNIKPYSIKKSVNQQIMDSIVLNNKLSSIIILTYNQIDYTKKCIDSILTNTTGPFELIVVDNGSNDGTVEYLESISFRKYADVRIKIIKNNENKGFAGGNNLGIAASIGDYIIIMNNDVVVTPGWLKRMIDCCEKRPHIGIVGPRSNYVSGPQLIESVDYNLNSLEGLNRFSEKIAKFNAKKSSRFLRVVGFCMLIKRDVIDKIGGLDDRYGIGNFEDDDFSIRAALAGFESRITEDCFVHHFGSRTFRGEKIDYRKSLQKNWKIFKEKWGLPDDLPYGSPYSISQMKVKEFNPHVHYIPLSINDENSINTSFDIRSSVEQEYSLVSSSINIKDIKTAIEKLQQFAKRYKNFAPVYNDLGVLYYKSRDNKSALEHYRIALNLDQNNIFFRKNIADLLAVAFAEYEEALQHYVTVLASDPKDVEALLATGHICARLERYDDAAEFYEKVLETEPHNSDAQNWLAKMREKSPAKCMEEDLTCRYLALLSEIAQEDLAGAITKIENFIEMYPTHGQAHNDLGVLYYKNQSKAEVLAHYLKAVEIEPENVTFRKNLADFLYVEEGRVEEALENYVEVLRIKPDDLETLLITGHICTAIERYEDAMSFYNKVLNLDPQNLDARQNMEVLERRQISMLNQEAKREKNPGDKTEVNQADPHASVDEVPIVPDGVVEELMNKADLLFQQERNDQAVDTLLKAIGVNPSDGTTYIELARQLVSHGWHEKALEVLSEMPLNQPEALATQKLLLEGYGQEGMGNYAAAKKCSDSVLDREPENAKALNLNGILAYRNDDKATAEQHFKRVIELDSEYGEPHTNLGALVWETSEPKIALEHYERGFSISPTDIDVANAYHKAVTATGEYKRAEKAARSALKKYPQCRKVLYLLVDTLIRQEKNEEALKELETALSTFGIDEGLLDTALALRERVWKIKKTGSAKDPGVSLCMIVKDEEANLARCLASVKPIVDEMVVVDTGSTDRTRDIAEFFGARVYEFEWGGDFAEARNFSLSKAKGDWIFIMDADEIISPQDYKRFRKLTAKKPSELRAYSIITRNYSNMANTIGWIPNTGQYKSEESGLGWLSSEKVRLFSNNSEIKFEGAVHEMVDPVLKRQSIRIKKCPISVHHYGRLNTGKLTRKDQTYFEIGRNKLLRNGGDIGAVRELAVQATVLEKNSEAIELWQKFLSMGPGKPEVSDAYVNMVSAYIRMQDYDNALKLAQKAVSISPQMKEAQYNLGIAELYNGNPGTAFKTFNKLAQRHPDFPPAQFLLAASNYCRKNTADMNGNIKKLKQSAFGPALTYSVAELAEGLITANHHKLAFKLLQNAIKDEIISKSIFGLYTDCLEKIKEPNKESDMIFEKDDTLSESISECNLK